MRGDSTGNWEQTYTPLVVLCREWHFRLNIGYKIHKELEHSTLLQKFFIDIHIFYVYTEFRNVYKLQQAWKIDETGKNDCIGHAVWVNDRFQWPK